MHLHRYLSRSIVMLVDCKISWVKNILISLFIAYYKPNMQEVLQKDRNAYANFNEFFARRLNADARPLAAAPIISPCDGRLKSAGSFSQGIVSSGKSETAQLEQPEQPGLINNIKGTSYSVANLLGLHKDSPLVQKFTAGQYANLYLAPKDYHRVHFPCSAKMTQAKFISGCMFPVNDKSVAKRPSLYAHNQRLACICHTDYGMMAIVLVAAMFVSSIGTSWGSIHRALAASITDNQERAFAKGDELGYFYMGSSVVILLENTELQLATTPDTNIKLGQALYSTT